MTKNTKINERKCRKNIARMLSLMGFKDNNIAAAVTVRKMLAKLRESEEKNSNKFPPTAAAAALKNKNRLKNRRIVIKFGGKRCLLDQESASSVIVPLEPPHSKTLVESCNKNMELKDSRNINLSCSSMIIVGDQDDDDVIIELKNIQILDSRKNVLCENNPNVEKYSRNNMIVSSQNPSTSTDSTRMNVFDDQEDDVLEFKNRDNIEVFDVLRIDNVTDFITSIGGTKAKLFFKKPLTSSDVKEYQGRLLMPGKQVEDSDYKLLNSNDKMIMERNDNNLSVTVFDPRRRKWHLNLTQWKMGRQINYVLKTQWKELVITNKLKL